MKEPAIYLGSRLRHLRRERGLTQVQMARDLEISPSYIALMERNQRPVTADILLRLARVYKIDFSSFSSSIGDEVFDQLRYVFQDPILNDLNVDNLEVVDVTRNFPNLAEALVRLHNAYRDKIYPSADGLHNCSSEQFYNVADPVLAVQDFISAKRNYFPRLDEAAERLSATIRQAGGLQQYIKSRHGLEIRRTCSTNLAGSNHHLDVGQKEIMLSDTLDVAGRNFELACQLATLEVEHLIHEALAEASFDSQTTIRRGIKALTAYFATALLMPYAEFAVATDERRYDVEALSVQFGTNFEQTAHRLTTLQRPGKERVPFFFMRVDKAGTVSKCINTDIFPVSRHGGTCPLWNIHDAFSFPDSVVTQWLEIDEERRFFSIARTVTRGGGAYNRPRTRHAVALVCEARYAKQSVYFSDRSVPTAATPIGVCCRLCQRKECAARSEPPIGHQLLPASANQTMPSSFYPTN
ncbi:hypothetical protein FB593_11740 [Rhizobium sp. SJZ105]|uniref:helix-turn-helix domain-containing protein n=1 Tax=Rhizobium sp. SJZ105 TaxID=2572678 RepID=UPI0011A8E192|nr:short-chain fatty acyl-CoA regulator family protein [Rhizobium sp. SJZ105]TWC77245.1 hypothetical protein FB593_11740 [Rhizobium sp. SJZ105]